jgi:hypothetical protein
MKAFDAEQAAERAGDKRVNLSGATYVSAMLREDLEKYPWRDNLRRLPATTPDRCQHGVSICSQWSCLESWSIDYRLFLHRTGAGRRIANEAGWDAMVDIASTPAHPTPNPKGDN